MNVTDGAVPASENLGQYSGTFYVQVSYSGDTGNAASTTTCGSENFTVTSTPAPTTLSTSLFGAGQTGSSVSVSAGVYVTDTATLAGTYAASADGLMDFSIYSDAACTDPVPYASGEAEITDGVAEFKYPLTTPGTYYWQASFAGGGVNGPSTSTCGSEVETVTPGNTTTATQLFYGGELSQDDTAPSVTVPAGTAVSDYAFVTNAAASLSGSVTFTVYSDDTCTTPVADAGTVPLSSSFILPTVSDPVTLTTQGTYYWQASYGGDAENLPSTSVCGSEVETVTAAGPLPTVSLTLTGGGQSGQSISVPAGTGVSSAATLPSSGYSAAGGTVTYGVYSNNTCTQPVIGGQDMVTVTDGVVPASTPITLAAGTYYWQASYVDPTGTVPSLTGACGAAVETVTGPPVADTVTYTVYSNSTCTTPVEVAGTVTVGADGVVPASPAVTLTNPGTYYWQAYYSGDATNLPSTSACGIEVETITGTATPVTVATSLSGGGQSGASVSVPTGTGVSDSATLSGTDVATAGGTVTYTVYSNSTCSTSVGSGGTVTVSGGVVPASGAVTLTTPGTYYWQASYSGDTTNAASTSTCGSEVETVTSTTTAVTVSTSLSGGGLDGRLDLGAHRHPGDRLGHPGRDQRGQRGGHGDLHRVLERHLLHLGG